MLWTVAELQEEVQRLEAALQAANDQISELNKQQEGVVEDWELLRVALQAANQRADRLEQELGQLNEKWGLTSMTAMETAVRRAEAAEMDQMVYEWITEKMSLDEGAAVLVLRDLRERREKRHD